MGDCYIQLHIFVVQWMNALPLDIFIRVDGTTRDVSDDLSWRWGPKELEGIQESCCCGPLMLGIHKI